MMDESTFARRTLRAYQVYADLAAREQVPEFRSVLTDLAGTSKEQFAFWARKSGVRGDMANISLIERWFFRIMRRILGLKTTAKLIVGRKKQRIALYTNYCATCTVPGDIQNIETFVSRLHAIIDRLDREHPGR